MSSKLVGILLAGGDARRFGGNKLAVPLSGGTPLGVCSAERLRAAVDELLVVIPEGNPATRALFADRYATTVCRDARDGVGRSIAHGVSICRDADAWLIALADMPFIDTATILAVAAALTSRSAIIRPRYRGRAGHPVGFGATYGEDLMDLQGDVGARSVVNAHRGMLRFIDTEDAGVVTDIDRPEDLEDPLAPA